jgi:hypothetical protein
MADHRQRRALVSVSHIQAHWVSVFLDVRAESECSVCKRSVMYVTLSKTSCRFDHSHQQVVAEHQTLDKIKLKELCSVWPRYRDVKRGKSRPCRQSGIHHPVRQLVSADHDPVSENSLSVYSSFDMLDRSDKRRVMRR